VRSILAVGMCTLVMSAVDVSAACKQDSLEGIWHYFASNVVLNEDGSFSFSYIEDCTFGIDARGVASGSECIDGTKGLPWGYTGFVVDQDCSIEAPSTTFCTLTGQISKNKQTVNGNGHCCCYEDAPGSENFVLPWQNSFTLVRKSAGPRSGSLAAKEVQMEPLGLARKAN
jgi:hypothetical protein